MKKFTKFFVSILAAVALAIPVLCAACSTDNEFVDYASQLKLDLTSSTKKQEVSVRLFIDGDTTHFDPVTNSTLTGYTASDFAGTQGYIKARYLAVNTPESTGQIEEWGKKASRFTHDKLDTAKSIIVESDKDFWDIDSTGERYLLWVWYIPEDGTEYVNLNLQLLQEGLAYGSKTSENRYGEIAQKALSQAEAFSLYVFSKAKDPDFYYGSIKEVSLKELRCHVADYNGIKVRVIGTITAQFENSVYIETLDEETGAYFGMPVYYGFNPGPELIKVLTVGNKVSVVGTVNAFHGNYQISGVLPINEYKEDDPSNSKVLATNQAPSFVVTKAADIISGTTSFNFDKEVKNENGEIDVEIEKVTLNKGEAILSTTVLLENLTVNRVTVTSNGGDSDGAMSLYCTDSNGTQITVRTEVLYDDDGNKVTPAAFPAGTKITVKGLVEKYVPDAEKDPDTYYYQVKVYRVDYITVL